MRYLTHYEQYPIYELAEGGYCYAGNQVVEAEKMSKRKAKKEMKRLWEEAQEENKQLPDRYKWVLCYDGNMIIRHSKYIGEGKSYIIERKKGSKTSGWHPYC